ncbi:hypothetical protein llap_12564 [Limosa lapponica baueri]|uniref:Uncharacterized protein n=1 Tax=Limosa lapponica baueri TaxID=1758121 RepID=A0A2I0TTL1_LIMLA|nr:hypothetical protein llap_12564 [Limosa lapponica baueri]
MNEIPQLFLLEERQILLTSLKLNDVLTSGSQYKFALIEPKKQVWLYQEDVKATDFISDFTMLFSSYDLFDIELQTINCKTY